MASTAPRPQPSPRVETVTAVFDGDELEIIPQRKVVSVGDVVEWRVRNTRRGLGRLEWTIYFHGRSPFSSGTIFNVRSSAEEIATFSPGPAVDPGDYKYGVRLQDANTGAVMGDDDPYLVVV